MQVQLRIYTVNRGRMDEFIKAWRDGVYPLRQKFGFEIPNAWVIKERNEFVWLMSYDGPGDWESKDKAYFGSPERKALDPDPAQYIAKMEHWFITPILSSQDSSLAEH